MAKETHSPSSIPLDGKNHSGWITLLIATACGLIAANLYYAQPLIGPIGKALGLPVQFTGLMVTLTQIGYGMGLLLIVPVGDIVENRRLITALLLMCSVALAIAAFAHHVLAFFVATICIGLSSVAAQILVPLAAHFAPEATRGRAVGNVMSGLMLGIMLARPVASFITDIWGWHTVFAASAVIMVCLAATLSRALPTRRPPNPLRYGQLVGSLWGILKSEPLLRRRAAYHACLFGAFSLFWTSVPLLLAGPDFQIGQRGIALFALAGVAGVIAAPLAGRLADGGFTRPVTGLAMVLVAAGFLMSRMHHDESTMALVILTAAAIVLDFGVSANVVVGQRVLFALGAQYRSRLNGLYMAIFFGGGAVGSALGGWAYAKGGWNLASWIGFALPIIALLYFATENRSPRIVGSSKVHQS